MPSYIVDPTRFYAEGAVVDWSNEVNRLGIMGEPPGFFLPLSLRWIFSAELGMPTEPFKVWARVQSTELEGPLTINTTSLLLFGYRVITWPEGTMTHVSVDVQRPKVARSHPSRAHPLVGNLTATVTVAAGTSTVRLSATVIDGLVASRGVTVTAVRGIESGALTQAAGWNMLEVVGLPVKKADWNGIGKHGDPQGIVDAFVDAPAAAVQRLIRGGPLFGWGPLVEGVPAPHWSAPGSQALVTEVNTGILEQLRGIVAGFPPNQQAAQTVTIPVPPPTNSSGDTVTTPSHDAQVSPLSTMLMGAGSDPFTSLVLGFGTSYNIAARPGTIPPPRVDYMITARWEKGMDGASAPVEFAAIVPRRARRAPPPPANLVAEPLGMPAPRRRATATGGLDAD